MLGSPSSSPPASAGLSALGGPPADRKQLLADAAEFWERAEAELEGR